jgi:peptidoglycan/LPS O-acetylase OafA/YrhL
VVGVVTYHAHVGAISGGFAGVDVFFVISGFLITGLLWRELDGTRRLSFAAFYARRARRLLPAAMLVLVVTMLASLAWLPPLQMRSVWKDGLASALYVGNYRFALTQTDYLAASTPPSPFQHFWSLGVEEQFYVIWPLLLVAASLIWWHRRPSRAGAVLVLGTVTVASFALSVWLTHANQPVAFFSLPTRAWELGLGALLALSAPEIRALPGRAAAALGWAGLAAIVAAFVVLDGSTPFPGTAALLPVLGAGAVVASGIASPVAGPVLVLGRAAARFVGRISYSWYLWHWPVLILAPYAVGHALTVGQYVALAVASGGLAALTYALVERPARSWSWFAARPARSLLAGAGLSLSGVCAALVVAASIPSVAGDGHAPVAAIRPTAPVAPKTGAHPAAPVDPVAAALASAESQVAAAVARSVGMVDVPANLDPPLTDASASEAAPMVDGCLLSFLSTSQPTCLFGDTAATRSIVLFGDSHAAMWFPAVDAYADAHGYRLYVWTKATCPPVDLQIYSLELGREFSECDQWRASVIAAIATLHPSLVVLANSPLYGSAYHVVEFGPAWLAGLSQVIASVRSDGSRVLVMGPIAQPPGDIPDCVSAHLDALPGCSFAPQAYPGVGALAATVQRDGGHYADVEPWFCTASRCPAVVDNLLVYRDDTHITVTYATYLAPLVGDEITEALAPSASR